MQLKENKAKEVAPHLSIARGKREKRGKRKKKKKRRSLILNMPVVWSLSKVLVLYCHKTMVTVP